MQATEEVLADVGLKYMVLYALSFDKNRQMGGMNRELPAQSKARPN